MTLLELPSGMISLEYAVGEQAEVRARLEAIAAVSVASRATHTEVKVGAETFLQMSDWDEPCLIAQTDAGNAILRRVAGSDAEDGSIAAE